MLRRRFGLRVFGATAAERLDAGATAAAYAQAKIVFNESVLGDVNFRVFEAMGAGAMLLTEAVGNGLADLFTAGVHLDTYTPATLAAKVARRLADDAGREAVARAGRREVAARHTLRTLLAATTALVERGLARRELGTDAARSFGLACQLALVRGLVHPELGARVAVEHLRAALAVRPDADVAIALGEMLAWIGRDAGALETLALARGIDPTKARAWLVAAEIARRRGDDAEAAQLVREAAERVSGLSPETRARVRAAAADMAGAEGCHALGLLLEEAGLPVAAGLVSQVHADVARTALDWHQRALAGDPTHGPAAERAAALLELGGMIEFAAPFRAVAARSRPGDGEADEALRRALVASYRATG
jgi:tetratricopeptide (TPR) repeat protein